MGLYPKTLKDWRSLLDTIDWRRLQREIEQESSSRLAIIGPVNAGKSTLFNVLKGRDVSPVSAVPGTTQTLIREQVGPFTLIDTPGFAEAGGTNRGEIASEGILQADLAILVLDGAAGLRQADIDLFDRVKATGRPVIVVLNKVDLLGRDVPSAVADAQRRLGVPVIPISAKKEMNIAERLIPAIIDAYPPVGIVLGRELPAYRRQAAEQLIRSAAKTNAIIGAEPIPGLDLPLLLATQVRLVLRIAAVYGEPMSGSHARELITTMAGGVALRFLAGEAAKALPGPGWLISGGIAAAGTYAIGQVAMRYFESGKKLSRREMRSMYKDFVKEQRQQARR